MLWYWLRWPGLVGLCLLVFWFGTSVSHPQSITVSSTADGNEFPVCRLQTEENKVALTFDAAYGDGEIQDILDILEAHQVRAAFFVTGTWAAEHPEAVRQIALSGQEIGSYGEHYTDLTVRSAREITEELSSAKEQIQDLTGIRVSLFRPPYDSYNQTVLAAAARAGYQTISWTIDSEDWKDYGAESIISSVLQSPELAGGAIIRLHAGAKYTADALGNLICGLEERGYEFVAVSG